ncbi:MAG: amidohydrolase family protein [Acidobacteriota bacterium]|nr:amidohydrolase family protein [Acidobacteriota bacterium]
MKTWIFTMLMALPLWSAEGPQVFAIQGARIVRVSAPPIENGTVVVRDGVIAAVGPNLSPPADAWIIDGKGLTVYPGLVDALSTWGIPGLTPAAGALAGRGRGATTPVVIAAPAVPAAPQPVINGPEDRPSNTSYLKAADQLVATDPTVTSARDAGFTTAVTFPTTNIFAGQGAMFDLSGERTGQMIVSPSAGLYLTTRTTSFGSYPGSLMGVFAYIRQIYLDAAHYKLANSIYAKHPQGLQRPAYDRTLEAVLASPRALLPARRMVEIERMIRFAQELKMNAVLYGGEEAWRSVDILRNSKVPILVSLKWPERARDADPALNDSLHDLEMRDKAPSTPAVLAKAGIQFAFYSDGIAVPKDVTRAVKRAIDAGLSPADAVRAMTLSPAEIYGVADRLGSIDPGKIANLLVTQGDLFQDKTKIKYVFVDGMKYEPAPDAAPAPKDMEKTQ